VQPAGALRGRRREAALLLAATLIAYANAFGGVFQFDDFFAIVGEPGVQSLAAWRESMPGLRPLLKLTYALNHALGAGLAGFHAVNLAIHASSVLLAWALLGAWLPEAGLDPGRSRAAALAAALLFALHPAQTEAVTYLSGRSMSLMALFSLAFLLAGLRSRDGRDGWMATSLACLAAALAVRETAWAAVPALVLLAAARGERGRALASRTLPAAALLVAGALLLLSLPAYRQLALSTLGRLDPPALVATQVEALGYLLTRPLLLLELNLDPDLRPRGSPGVTTLATAAALGLPLAVAAWQWRRRPWLAAALAWPFLVLAPMYSVFARADVANDRHLYLALLGPAVVAGGALAALPARPRVAATCCLCLLLGLVTVGRNTDYRSETALWTATAAVSPDKPRVWNNLGYALLEEGDAEAAARALRRALALDPGYLRARYNLAEAEARLGAAGVTRDGPAASGSAGRSAR
jgi:tetratricopeptide (TPR) repeat protein